MLPGPVTLIVTNPAGRFPHLCGATPERIGVRVPVLVPEVARLADAVGGLALTSANLRGEPAPARARRGPPADLRSLCAVADRRRPSSRGAASSVIDVTGPEPVLIRAGADAESALARLR